MPWSPSLAVLLLGMIPAVPEVPATDTVRVDRKTLARALANPASCTAPSRAEEWPEPIVVEEMNIPGQYLFMADGRFIVYDRTAKRIRIIAPSGKEIGRVGGQGNGPGEFQLASYFFRWAGDTIAVRDVSTARISFFTNQGFTTSISHGAVPSLGVAGLMGRLADGTLIFGANHSMTEGVPNKGIHRPTIDLVRWRPGAGGAEVVRAGFPGPELRIVMRNKERSPFRVNFPRRTLFGVTDHSILVHDDGKTEIEILDPSGRTKRVLTFEVTDPPISKADRDSVGERHELGFKRGFSSTADMELLKQYPPTRAAMAWHGTDAANGFWLAFHPPVASGSKVYVRFTETGIPTRCFRPTDSEDFGIAFSNDRVVTRRQEAEGDVLRAYRTAPYPTR